MTKKDTQKANELIGKTKAPSKAKKATPVNDAIEGHEAKVDALIRAHFIKTKANEVFSEFEAPLIKVAKDFYDKMIADNKPSKSVYLKGSEFPHIAITFTDKFSAIDENSMNVIIEGFVKDGSTKEEAVEKFNQHFQIVRKITMTDTSDATIALLGDLLQIAEMLADDDADPTEILSEEGVKSLRRKIRSARNRGAVVSFADLFVSKTTIETKSGVDFAQNSFPESIRQLLNQNKASTKVSATVQTKASGSIAMKEIGECIIDSIVDDQ